MLSGIVSGLFAKSLALFSIVHFTAFLPQASAQETVANTKSESDQILAAIKPIEGKFSISDVSGKTITPLDITKGSVANQPLVVHLPDQDLHLLVSAEAQANSQARVFLQLMQTVPGKSELKPTNHFTQVWIDPNQDPAVAQAIIEDAAKVLISDAQSARSNFHAKDKAALVTAQDLQSSSRKPTSVIPDASSIASTIAWTAAFITAVVLVATGIALYLAFRTVVLLVKLAPIIVISIAAGTYGLKLYFSR